VAAAVALASPVVTGAVGVMITFSTVVISPAEAEAAKASRKAVPISTLMAIPPICVQKLKCSTIFAADK
jgi:flagellar basal body-associated protein FliL